MWAWAYRKDEVRPANPLEGLRQDMGALGKAPESYEAFDEKELKAVFGALGELPGLSDLALKSLYSGMRLSECLRAERRDVEGVECFVLGAGKTTNAKRIIPVHGALKDVKTPQGFSAGILSVNFGRAVKDLKLPPRKVFHSLRKNFATALERAGCPEPVAVRLLGHRPLSMSYRVYSAGRGAAELREWVDKVAFKVR